MKIIGQTISYPVIEDIPVIRLFDNTKETEQRMDPIIVEHPFSIMVNGQPCCALTCSPDRLVQLAVGHLFSQGYIDGLDWIDTIEISEDGSEAAIILAPGKKLNPMRPLPIIETRNPVKQAHDQGQVKQSGNEIDKDGIFAQAKALYDSADWFFQTGAAHSSSLSVDGVILYRFADVSRHNTIDKIVGQALMDGVDLTRARLFTSGRIPLDMLLKVARCGIPVVGSRSAPTTAALAMAKKLGITLVGFVRQGRMNVY